MRRLAGLSALLCILPGIGLAHSVTVEIWSSPDPSQTIFCSLHLLNGRMTAVEVKGLGMPPDHNAVWPTTPRETKALTDVLQTLLDKSLSPEAILASRTPPPPFLSVTWFTELNGRPVSGLTFSTPDSVPPDLRALINTVLPGGYCDQRLSPY
ncbi:hypothetical protein [Tabrizicola sp.]|uniref:hypothetical protein n=1 Tax=Tabrizicola sp. TaxID=2005166 RepID=UPI003F2E9CC8